MTSSNTSASLSSERFQVPASEVFLYLLFVPRKSWVVWSLSCFGLILIAVGIFVDMRVMAVGLLVWLALVPTAAFFMHYSEALSPSVAPNLLPHTVERISGGYIVRVYRRQTDDDTGEISLVESGIITVSDSEITGESVSGTYRRLSLSSPALSILFLSLNNP